MTTGPMSISLKEVDKLVGKFAVLFRNNQKTPAKIIEIDVTGGRMVYELLGGADKGKKMTAKYDPAQSAMVYDSDNVMLALLDT